MTLKEGFLFTERGDGALEWSAQGGGAVAIPGVKKTWM